MLCVEKDSEAAFGLRDELGFIKLPKVNAKEDGGSERCFLAVPDSQHVAGVLCKGSSSSQSL